MSIQDIFDSMDYGQAPESDSEAQGWLEGRGRAFGHGSTPVGLFAADPSGEP